MRMCIGFIFVTLMLTSSLAWECGKDYAGNQPNVGMTKLKQFPWLGSCNFVGYDANWNPKLNANSRAVLISPRFALTTGIIANNYGGPPTVTFGDHCSNATLQCHLNSRSQFLSHSECSCPVTAVDVKVARSVLHPNYDEKNDINNIGILEFENDIELSEYIQPICLPDSDMTVEVGDKLLYSTYGDYDRPSNISRRRTMSLQIRDYDECVKRYESGFLPIPLKDRAGTLCVDHERNFPCFGDFGAPLMTRDYRGSWTAVAILDKGISRCREPDIKLPSIFVDLRKHVEWIKSNIG